MNSVNRNVQLYEQQQQLYGRAEDVEGNGAHGKSLGLATNQTRSDAVT